MPSPFPGMDPYIEAPDIWPDFHHAFATEIRNALNRTMPKPYYARLEMRPEIGIVDEEDARSNRAGRGDSPYATVRGPIVQRRRRGCT